MPLCIYFWYQTDSEVPNTSIYSGVSLASPYYNYLLYTASTTMICWRCHSNSVNYGSRLPSSSDIKTRKGRNVVGIDMIRNNRISWSYTTGGMYKGRVAHCLMLFYIKMSLFYLGSGLYFLYILYCFLYLELYIYISEH